MGFFDLQEDLEQVAPILFVKGDIVKFLITSLRENEKVGLWIEAQVLSPGDHEGKILEWCLSNKTNKFARQRKISFFMAFWTLEELQANKASPDQLIGRAYSATAGPRWGEQDQNQDWGGFKDLGTPQTSMNPPSADTKSDDDIPF